MASTLRNAKSKHQQISQESLKERNSNQLARAEMEVNAVAPYHVVRFQINPAEDSDQFLAQNQRGSPLMSKTAMVN